jgi:hypothetical protein
MRKVLLFVASALVALLLSFDGAAPTVSQAEARIGRPLTPFSVAGVHRRVMRRNFGAGWRHPYVWHHHNYFPAAGYYGWGAPGYGGWGSGAGFYPGVGWGAPGVGIGWGPGFGGWGSGLGWRPGLGVGAPGFGWHRGWF